MSLACPFSDGCSSLTKMASFTPLSRHLSPLGETAAQHTAVVTFCVVLWVLV